LNHQPRCLPIVIAAPGSELFDGSLDFSRMDLRWVIQYALWQLNQETDHQEGDTVQE
jgi:hypothetical protein